MSTTNRIQKLLRVVALLSVLGAAGGLAYIFTTEGGEYGYLPVVVPLAITAVALLLDLVITVATNIRTVSRGDATEAEIYLFKFRRSNFYIGLLFLLLGVVVLVVENGVLPWTVPPLVRSLLSIAVQVFGGLTAVLITAAVFGGIWYALRQRSREAVYAGMAIWALVALTGVGYLRLNGSGAGLVIGGLLGVYYGAMARKATELRYLGGQSTGTGQSHSGTSGGEGGPAGRQATPGGNQTGRNPEQPREPTPRDARGPRRQPSATADSQQGSTPRDPGAATHRAGASPPESSRNTNKPGSTGGQSGRPQTASGDSQGTPGPDDDRTGGAGTGRAGTGGDEETPSPEQSVEYGDGTGGDGAGEQGIEGDEAGEASDPEQSAEDDTEKPVAEDDTEKPVAEDDTEEPTGRSPEPTTDPDIYYDPDSDPAGETSPGGTVEPPGDSGTGNDDLYYDPDEADDGDADDGAR